MDDSAGRKEEGHQLQYTTYLSVAVFGFQGPSSFLVSVNSGNNSLNNKKI
jgi:hypothetical protein